MPKQGLSVVLSADDDENAGILLLRAFTRAKVEADIHFVPDGEEALAYLSGRGKYSDRAKYPFPNLFLLDLKMPKMTGLEVLEKMKGLPGLSHLPVVVLSSSGLSEDIEKARSLGCSDYAIKPGSFEELITFVRRISAEFLCGSPRPADDRGRSEPRESRLNEPLEQIRPKSPQNQLTRKVRPAEGNDIFRLLVEQVKDYAIFMLDTDGFILSWNEGARRLKGYEASEIIGRHFSTFYPPTEIEMEKPAFELRLANETGRYEEEGWRVRKDGTRFWANVVITALREKDGRLRGFAKVTRDLTQRKFQDENMLRLLESEERFRLLVEQVKDYAIFILDAKGNIISWNQGARRLKGYSSDEIIGKHFSIFYTPEDLATDKPTRELNTAVREGRYEEEGWRVRKDGTQFWANVVLTSLWDKRGNLTGFAKVTRDLTDRKREEERLRQKTTELEAFAHTLSHDLRSPLRSILGFAELLKTEGADISPDESEEYLNKIFNAATIMDRLIDDILAYSRVGLANNAMERVPLSEVLAEVRSIVDREIKNKKADIQIENPLPIVIGNRTLLLQVFSNLVGNALKFVSPGVRPQIEIFTSARNGQIDVFIKDNGIGIAPEHQERVFNVFEQINPKSNYSGTGVGLAIVKKAVERMGGSIRLDSHQGIGSTFVLTLFKAAENIQPSVANQSDLSVRE